MAQKNIEAIRALHECFNRRDFDGAVRPAAPTFTFVDHARGRTLKTSEEFKGWMQEWARGFSDARVTEARYLDAGDVVISQFKARGTNDGSFGGQPATGRRVEFDVCEIHRFDESGRIIGGDIYFDQLSIMSQLGLAPQAAPRPSPR